MNNLAIEAVGTTPQLSALVSPRTWDEASGIYQTETGFGIAVEVMPVIGLGEAEITAMITLLGEINLKEMTVQVINQASPRIHSVLDRWVRTRTETALARARIDHFARAVAGEVYASQGWRPRHYRVFVMIHRCGQTLTPQQEDGFIRLQERLIQTFSAIGTPARKLTAAGMVALLKDMLLPSADVNAPGSTWSETELIHEQVTCPGLMMDVGFGEIAFTGLNNAVMRSYSIQHLPEHWPPGAGATLIGDIFHPSSFCARPVLQCLTFRASAISAEMIGMRAARANKAANSPMRFLNPNTTAEVEDFAEVGAAMAAGEAMVSVQYQLVLSSEPEGIEEAEARLRDLFERQGFGFVREDGLHLVALKSALPFGNNSIMLDQFKRFGRLRTIKCSNSVTLMPLYGEWQGNDRGKPPLMLLAGRRGEVAGWTPFNSSANYNTCIVGMSGQGKSVAMQEIMASMIGIGGAVVVIDDGYSFQNSAAILGGSHVDFGGQGLELNPFSAIDTEAMEQDGDFAETALAMLTNFITALAHPGQQPSDLERAVITDAVQTCWQEKGGHAQIDDIIATLQARGRTCEGAGEKRICDELVTLLSPFRSSGTYGRMFAGGCSVQMNNDLMVFEMSHLRDKKQVQAAAMTLLIFLATQMMYHSPRSKPVAVMVDEAWALLSGSTADFIEGVARRARKYNGALITATQGVDDYFRSPAAEAAWANSSWRLFLRMQDSSIEALKAEKKVVCDAILERGLQSLHSMPDVWSEIIIHSQTGWDICRLILDPVSLAAYSSQADDVAAINALIKGGMSRADAIIAHAADAQEKHGGIS